jgi:dGTPase
MSPDDVRHCHKQLVAFAPDVAKAEAAIKAFLKQHMYRHPRVMRVMGEAEDIVANLFARYLDDPATLPAEWQDGIAQESEAARARRIGNFIAGMTDRFALTEHQRLFDSTPELR